MRAYLIQTYNQLSGSYWFFPAMMAIAAAVLALVIVQIDTYVPASFFGDNPFFYATQPDGARSILNAIGGSMIGVAGTVFSVTMATVVFASGSYGPRLLTNFMSNRGNQLTLGTFVATFVYCILVLRSVRDGSSNSGYAVMFVPNFAVYGAIALGICSIAVLIFFIHHVPSNIHISNVVADIGRALGRRLDEAFPRSLGIPADKEKTDIVEWQVPPCFRDGADVTDPPAYGEIEAKDSGYLQVIDDETLMKAAREYNLVIRLNCQPGTFVHPGLVLFDAWPAERLTEEARAAVYASIALGNMRNPAQDLVFLIDELVEIAGRALSPGVNDPFTAISCMDWLASAYSNFVDRTPPTGLRVDAEDRLRLVTPTFAFAHYLERGFGNLRQYVAADRLASVHFIRSLAGLLAVARREDQVHALAEEKYKLHSLARKALSGYDLEAVEEEARAFDERMKRPGFRAARCGHLV